MDLYWNEYIWHIQPVHESSLQMDFFLLIIGEKIFFREKVLLRPKPLKHQRKFRPKVIPEKSKSFILQTLGPPDHPI